MKLKEFYSLRKDFTIIGLTGRIGAGCSQIADLLKTEGFLEDSGFTPVPKSLIPEEIKFNICYNYLIYEKNFEPFNVINYKDVLLLHVLFDAKGDKDEITKAIYQFGDSTDFKTERFNTEKDKDFIEELNIFFKKNTDILDCELIKTKSDNLKQALRQLDEVSKKKFIDFYFEEFVEFSNEFHKVLNSHCISKRSLFNHDIAINLRKYGTTIYNTEQGSQDHIYTIAETINHLIKCWRLSNDKKAKILIDSLKNSLELMYFKEKFGGFYMVAVNKSEEERGSYLEDKIKDKTSLDALKSLDDAEYKGDEFSEGEFSSPDVENCIQKSDFHIFHSKDSGINSKNNGTNLSYQLIKLLALIAQPGIITPTAIERTMQVAYTAKYNSGCISRQVGAVVTDASFIVKSIGWNDVAKGQMPCKLRDVTDLIEKDPHGVFSEYEINGEVTDNETKETNKFKTLVKKEIDNSKINDSTLGGRHCSFCFKSLQNKFERVKNQVHTRSLHAEENAMMQISKKGGNGLEAGKLFTTASPCELCSKKAFQLGVTEIYYIDPYPGIAMTHTLRNGVSNDGASPNPEMIMFRGSVGRAFHKLYEPFMSYKDEIAILTEFKPKATKLTNEELINKLEIGDLEKNQMREILRGSRE